MIAAIGASVSVWPYASGNTLVDVVLFGIYCVLFGIFFTWGQRIGSKLP